MGEYIPASIQFGGKISKQNAEEVIEILRGHSLHTWDDGEEADPTLENLGREFGNSQINYGNLDSLTDFAIEHGLSYRYWYDAGCEWPAATEVYFAGTEEMFGANGSVGHLSLGEEAIRRLGSYDAVLAHFEQINRDLPPLEITDK
jgi:hypothetical protein